MTYAAKHHAPQLRLRTLQRGLIDIDHQNVPALLHEQAHRFDADATRADHDDPLAGKS
ncbi:MAG TPA: hypothetical protein VHU42_10725 [Rhodopila sp.]|nr:hypothetical protein [Rhodopila sp.]